MEIDLKDLFRLLLKNSLVLIICAIVGLAGAFSISKYLIKPSYISSVKMYVYTKNSDAEVQGYNYLNDLNYAQKIVNTYIEMLRTDNFYKAVKDKVSLNYSIPELKSMISFTVLNDTEVFQVSVTSHKPEDSKQIADTITMLAPQTIRDIKESALLRVVDSASFPLSPSSPNIPVNSAVGCLVGIVIAVIFVFLKESLDVRIKQEEDLTEKYNIPILGSIPSFKTGKSKSIIFQGEGIQNV